MNSLPTQRHAARGDLQALINRFKHDPGYPQAEDLEQIAARAELARLLSEASLDATIGAPETFDTHAFMRLAFDPGAYGYPGNQVQINVHLRGGDQAIAALARTIRYLLYGPGNELNRLDDVLSKHSKWKVRGFGEALSVKCLAISQPDRWLPLFVYHSKRDNGKRAMMQLPELPIEPLREEGKSPAQLATESNDAFRDLFRPYFGEDPWGPVQFLWWRLQSAHRRGSPC